MPVATDDRRWKGICEVLKLTKGAGRTSVRIGRPSKALLARLEAEGCTWKQGKGDTIELEIPSQTETLAFPEPQATP